MKTRRSSAVSLCFFAGLASLCAGGTFAGQATPTVTHFLDSTTERVPSLTAFPKYPSIARRDRIEGDATVCFRVKENGKVARAIVTDYTHKIFSKPALQAIRKSSFEPLEPGQIASPTRTCRTYRFRLEPVLADNETDSD